MEKNRPNTFACIRMLYPRSSVVPLNFYLHAFRPVSRSHRMTQNSVKYPMHGNTRLLDIYHESQPRNSRSPLPLLLTSSAIKHPTSLHHYLDTAERWFASIRVDSVDERKWRERRKIFFPRLVPVRISAGLRRSSLRLTRHATTYTVSKTSVDY